MSYGSATVLGRVERRHRFSVEKLAVVAEASARGSTSRRYRGAMRVGAGAGVQVVSPGGARVIGIPGASELPSFVAVEITKEAAPLPVPVPVAAPTEIAAGPPRQRRKKGGPIEIELGGGRLIRVDRDVDAAELDRVLEVLSRR
jgi:transposase